MKHLLKTPRAAAALLATAAMAALMIAPQVAGAAIPVTTQVDEYPAGTPANTAACSLREAISQANADGAAFGGCAPAAHNDLILLPPGTYELEQAGAGEDGNTTGDFDVGPAAATGSLTIVGTGPGPSNIDALGATDRSFDTASSVLTIDGLTIHNAALGAGAGGGIRNDNGQLTLRNSTIEGNSAPGGGGAISSDGPAVTIENSTISDNFAFMDDGGGLLVNGAGNTATLRNVTVTTNFVANADEGGGIANGPGTVVTLSNTIVAGNTNFSMAADDCAGGISSAGNNLIASTAACPGFSPLGSDLLNVNPLLGPLASNGGPTQTHALLAGSPAIDKGAGCLAADQRGIGRVGACDIGAFEFVPPAATPIARPPVTQPQAKKKCKKKKKRAATAKKKKCKKRKKKKG